MNKIIGFMIAMLLVGSIGICSAAEITIPPDPTPIASIVNITKGSINITEGWNLIAMPVLPIAPYPAAKFAKDVAYSDQSFIVKPDVGEIILPKFNWQVRTIAVYKNGRFEACYPNKNLTPYNMVPSEAYFVYVEYLGMRPVFQPEISQDGTTYCPPVWHPRTSVTIPGKAIDKTVSLNLNRGWNGVSLLKQNLWDSIYPAPIPMPKISPDITTDNSLKPELELCTTSLNQLSQELVAQGIKATKAIFWDADNQEWVKFDLPRPTVPPIYNYNLGEPTDNLVAIFDRFIRDDEGFFLLAEENGLFIPGLGEIIAPPIEKRVSYTGKVEGVFCIPEQKPPYDFVLRTRDGETVYLKPIDDKTGGILAQAANYGGLYTIEGVIKYLPSYNYGIEYTGNALVKVVMVDKAVSAIREAALKVTFKPNAVGIKECLEHNAIYTYTLTSAITEVLISEGISITLVSDNLANLDQAVTLLNINGIENINVTAPMQLENGTHQIIVSSTDSQLREIGLELLREMEARGIIKITNIANPQGNPITITTAYIGDFSGESAERMAVVLKAQEIVADVQTLSILICY